MDESPDLVRVLIERDLTLSAGSDGLVAVFDEPVMVYRAFDGLELAIVCGVGRFEGGMFATLAERKWGASWAGTSKEDVAEWAAGWAKRKRIGKDLFVAVADAQGHVFFREGARTEVEFDPDGPPVQPALMNISLCSTGLGCSIVINTRDVTFYRVGDAKLTQMSDAKLRTYVDRHSVPPVALRNFGFGTPWYSGLILGEPVVVGQDAEDKLWNVENRAGETIVIGAKTKAAAVKATEELVADGFYGAPVRLNRIPRGFANVEIGDEWHALGGHLRQWTGRVERIGATYVVLRGKRPWDQHERSMLVRASELMKKWEERP